jgi:hypothetical protein
MNTRKRGGEMVHVDENGRRSSAWFHEPILAAADDTELVKRSRAEVKLRHGFTEEDLDEMYGPKTRIDRAEAKRMGYTEEQLDKMFGPETK